VGAYVAAVPVKAPVPGSGLDAAEPSGRGSVPIPGWCRARPGARRALDDCQCQRPTEGETTSCDTAERTLLADESGEDRPGDAVQGQFNIAADPLALATAPGSSARPNEPVR
jgi:hypothetical protein